MIDDYDDVGKTVKTKNLEICILFPASLLMIYWDFRHIISTLFIFFNCTEKIKSPVPFAYLIAMLLKLMREIIKFLKFEA
jgi:hypothetical protein